MAGRHAIPGNQFRHGASPVPPGVQQKRAHQGEPVPMSRLVLLGGESVEGDADEGVGPFAFISGFRRIACGAGVFLLTERDGAVGTAALLAGGVPVIVDHEIPQAGQQIGTETPQFRVGAAGEVFFEQMPEEGRGDVLGILMAFARTENVGVEGRPVGAAKGLQGRTAFGGVGFGGIDDDGPAGGVKMRIHRGGPSFEHIPARMASLLTARDFDTGRESGP